MNRTGVSLVALHFLTAIVLIPAFVSRASAQHVQQFFFNGANGSHPVGGVIADAEGNLYGTTLEGGSTGRGVVYELSRASNGEAVDTLLYNFTGSGNGGDGGQPRGNLIFDDAGNLYGVTQFGGVSNQGTVFELSPPSSPGAPWIETVIYSFQGSPSDGARPATGLVLDSTGNLYGTTSLGGINSPLVRRRLWHRV
jgi:uncharacterized repeat protein (TIGR03803 family)